MKDWLALRNLLAVIIVWATLLAGTQAIINQGANDVVIPPPEKVAANMMQALKAHRYEGAQKEFSEEAQADVEQLQHIVQSFESRAMYIKHIEGIDSNIFDDAATATVLVELIPPQEKLLTFSLLKENGEWKIDSTKPLNMLLDN